MVTSLLYRFDRIAPNTTASLFIHGYSSKDAAVYSVVIYNGFSQTNEFPQAHVTLTQGETFRWIVDGTVARKIYITNHQLFTQVAVDVIEMKDSY
jgi:hypothetical protein